LSVTDNGGVKNNKLVVSGFDEAIKYNLFYL